MLLGGAPAQAHPGPEAHGPDVKPQTQTSVKARTGGGAMGFMAPGMVTGGDPLDGYGITSGFGRRTSPGGVGSTTNHLVLTMAHHKAHLYQQRERVELPTLPCLP